MLKFIPPIHRLIKLKEELIELQCLDDKVYAEESIKDFSKREIELKAKMIKYCRDNNINHEFSEEEWDEKIIKVNKEMYLKGLIHNEKILPGNILNEVFHKIFVENDLLENALKK